VTLASGVQYRILTAGQGPTPALADTVVCHYRGTLINGTVFDSSYKRKQPATFALARVIKGWGEALQRMPVGSKWQLVIPSGLAYGEKGAGRVIGPNATLVFDVELIAIADKLGAHGTESEPGATVAAATPVRPIPATAPPASPRMTVFFKVDPRIASGNYGGDRWLNAPYTRVGEGKTCTIEARSQGAGAVTWTASDPEMVTIAPGQGKQITLTVRHAGESRVRVSSDATATELTIKAVYRNDTLQVEISQS
jgi:hypothetical protein